LELRRIQDQLATLGELTGQTQRVIASLRDQLASNRQPAPPPAIVDSLGTDTGRPQVPVMDPSVRDGDSGADAVYNAAITQLNRGSLGTARRAFERFLDQFPNHRLAPDAHFFLADILVQENRLDEAKDAFLHIPELFPTAQRVPWALYRVALLEIEMDNLDGAREYLNRVVNTYPSSGVAELARERLQEIG
jgi:tol-pal system protein YbgF